MNESYEFEEADVFTIGTIGEPGQRLFLMQIRQGMQSVTLKVEKEQMTALAAYIGEFLKDLPRPGHLPEGPELDLKEPLEPQWAVGAISIDYLPDNDRIEITCDESMFDEDAADLDAPAAEARIVVTREQIAAFAIQAVRLVEAGRPPCPLCGFPLEPQGHACPRTNGNRQPTL